MAVITDSIHELNHSRTHTHNIENERTYTRQWTVETTTQTDDAKIVADGWSAHTGIQRGTAFPSDVKAVAKSIRVECDQQAKDGRKWLVTCEYGPFIEDDLNPLLWKAKDHWSFVPGYQETVDFDVYGVPVTNSAGDPFLEPVVREGSRLQLTVDQNELVYNYVLAQLYRGSINADPWQGWPPYTVLCVDITAEPAWDMDIGKYYQCKYVFHFEPRTWKKILLDQGLRELDASSPTGLRNIVHGTQAVNAPYPLDGAGQALPLGDPYQYAVFSIYPELPFTSVFNFTF